MATDFRSRAGHVTAATGANDESDVRISDTAGAGNRPIRCKTPSRRRHGCASCRRSTSSAGSSTSFARSTRCARRSATIDLNRIAAIAVRRRGARRRPPPADQAVHRERRSLAQARRPHLAGAVGNEPGVHARLSAGARRRRCRRPTTRAGASALPLLFVRLVHFHGTDAKLRVFKYERWIPAQVDRAASDLSARMRDAVRPAGDGAAGGGRGGAAVVGRAGIPLRAAGASAQHRQPVARPRSTGPARSCARGAAACRWSRFRSRWTDFSSISPDAKASCAAPATIAARCCAISTPRRSPKACSARSTRCAMPR